MRERGCFTTETLVMPSLPAGASGATLSGPGPSPTPAAGCGEAVERAVWNVTLSTFRTISVAHEREHPGVRIGAAQSLEGAEGPQKRLEGDPVAGRFIPVCRDAASPHPRYWRGAWRWSWDLSPPERA